METNTPFSTFERPPGSPVYSNARPALVIPRRVSSVRSYRSVAPLDGDREYRDDEARRQLGQLLLMLSAVGPFEVGRQPSESGGRDEFSRPLAEMEARIAERERAVVEHEFRLADRERDLAEAEVLLKHHEALVAVARKTLPMRSCFSEEERVVLLNLKTELDRQEALLRESRDALREREKFVEESEKRLFEKVQQQQEKETELEQREEEIQLRQAAGGNPPGGDALTPGKFDEFNE